jgi:KTSC domain
LSSIPGMRASEILNEVGNAPAASEVVHHDDQVYQVNSPEIGLILYLTRGFTSDSDDPNIVFIEFSIYGEFELTGEGNAVKIFSTVNDILKSALKEFVLPTDHLIEFSADNNELSRIKFYSRIVPVISRMLGPDWKFANASPGRTLHTFSWERVKESLKEVAVASTWITDLTYTRPTKTLTMTLNNGRRFAIQGISRQSFDRWKSAPSKGTYFHSHVRDRFPIKRSR